MPTYSYRAVDSAGRRVEGTCTAGAEAEARAQLRRQGIYPLNLTADPEGNVPWWRRSVMLERVGAKDLLLITQQLTGLLEAGIPIDRSLGILAELSEKRPLRATLSEIVEDIQAGRSLSEALRRHTLFPSYYVNMIMAGEAGGVLDTVVKRLALFLESSIGFREEIRTALIYPILLVAVGAGAVGVLVTFVLPRFAVLFEDMGQSVPLITRWILRASEFVREYWWVGAIGIGGAVILFRIYRRTEEGRLALDGIRLRVPVVRELGLKVAISRFCRTLGTLLSAGVPILRAVTISREVLDNEALSRALAPVEEGLRRGRGLSGPLRESGVFPTLVSHMITVGEESGRLEDTLILVADRFEQESRTLLKRLLGLLEPLIILVMALVVGTIILAMVFTIFSVHDIPI